MKYKDVQNKVHEIEPAFEYMLPLGCRPISDEEAAAILNPPKSLEQVKEEKKTEIRSAFEIDSNSSVTLDTVQAIAY